MAGRGRGVPNLASAGVREEKGSKSNGNDNKGGRGRGRGRGGRGGGRGRGGGGAGGQKPRQELIQSMGIFSDGLHAEDRKKERVKLEFEGGGQRRVKEETSTIAEMTNAQVSSARGYAELWESDESGDEEELKELIRDNFLHDAKCGRVMPLVTPHEEEPQFKRLLPPSSQSGVKKELMSDEEEEKPQKASPSVEGEEEEDPFPTLTRSRAAASIVEKMMEGGSSSLLLLQIPSVVPILARSTVESREEHCDPNAAHEEAPACASGLPRGTRVGRVRATADGGVEMRIGGQTMTLTKNIGGDSGYCDTLALVEVPPSALVAASSESSGMFGGRPPMGGPSGASVSHLGDIHHHMVASLDWTSSLLASRSLKGEKKTKNGKRVTEGEEEEMDWSNNHVKKEMTTPSKQQPHADKAALETRMETVEKRRAERAKFLAKWGTDL